MEQEATGEQLSALRARLNAGLVPYADFAVWRPHGARLLRQLEFQAHFPSPGGGWRTKEIAGPSSFWRLEGELGSLRICHGGIASCITSSVREVRVAHREVGRYVSRFLVDRSQPVTQRQKLNAKRSTRTETLSLSTFFIAFAFKSSLLSLLTSHRATGSRNVCVTKVEEDGQMGGLIPGA